MTAFQWLILVIVIVIAVPVVRRILQDRDFNRQIQGKRPMRQIKKDQDVPASASAVSPELESELEMYRHEAKTRTFQHFFCI